MFAGIEHPAEMPPNRESEGEESSAYSAILSPPTKKNKMKERIFPEAEQTPEVPVNREGQSVVWYATSIYEFNVYTERYEAGHPYLSFQQGEVRIMCQQTIRTTKTNSKTTGI